MEIQIKCRIYDDHRKECKEGDTILLQTTTMPDLAVAIINEISVHSFTVTFDDKLLGFAKQRVRPDQVLHCELYHRK